MKHNLTMVLSGAAMFAAIAMSNAREANAGGHYVFYSAPPAYYVAPPVYYHPSVFAPPATVMVPAPQRQYYAAPVQFAAPAPAYYQAPAPAYAPAWVPVRRFKVDYDWNPWHGVWEVEYEFDD